MLHTDEVSACFPCYPVLSQYWENVTEESIRALSNLMTSMLKNNGELNELTSIPLSGFHKSMNKLNKVGLNTVFVCHIL